MVEVVAITSKVEASGGESGRNASGWMTMGDVRGVRSMSKGVYCFGLCVQIVTI